MSPVLRALCTTLNDSLDEEPRQRLRPYLARTIGTESDGFDETRAWLAMDWRIRTYAPTWLGAAGLPWPARRLSTLPAVLGSPELRLALEALAVARRDARTAWCENLGSGRAAAWAPWAAGRATARECAWGSAGAVAWAAVRLGVGDISRRDRRAGGADADQPRRSAGSGPDSSCTHAAELQRSAFELLDRMLPTASVDPAVGDGLRGRPARASRACSVQRVGRQHEAQRRGG